MISYGEEQPADPGHSEEAWAKNRRDQFSFSQQIVLGDDVRLPSHETRWNTSDYVQ